MTIRVRVDEALCQGHGRCYAVATELFEPDDIGNGHPVGDGAVATDQRSIAELAVANCPEKAITIEADPTHG